MTRSRFFEQIRHVAHVAVSAYALTLLEIPVVTLVDSFRHGAPVDLAQLMGALIFIGLLSLPFIVLASVIAISLHHGIEWAFKRRGGRVPLIVTALVGAVAGAPMAPEWDLIPIVSIVGATSLILARVGVKLFSWQWFGVIAVGTLIMVGAGTLTLPF